MIKDLTTFLQEKESPGDWLNIANLYNIDGTNKQKSDYVRRLWKSLHRTMFTRKESNGTVTTTAQLPFTTYVKTTSSVDDLLAKVDKYLLRLQQIDHLEKTFRNEDVLPKSNKNNVLVIGDIHEPFCKEGYLEFCVEQQKRFNCGTVVFIGDLIDNHAQSFHHTDADGLSAKQELELAVTKLEKWYQAFPDAIVTLGNHDRIVARKLFSVGISQRWLKPLGDVLNTPNWKFVEQHIHNGVLYVHGESGTALKKAQQEMCSVVQGHLHTEGYVQFLNGGKNFAMQVGCGIDFSSYAFAYAQRGKQPVISCGVVLDQSPIVIPFQK